MNPKRVYRLMREDNLLCVRRRKFVVTTDSNHTRKAVPCPSRIRVLAGPLLFHVPASCSKAAITRNDAAKLLQVSLQGLTSTLYMRPIAHRYTVFDIPKKGGGARTIKAPDEKLKLLQKKLSALAPSANTNS